MTSAPQDTAGPDTAAQETTGQESEDGGNLVEIGWVVTDDLGEEEVRLVRGVATAVSQTLAGQFPAFHWRGTVVVRPAPPNSEAPGTVHRAEPAGLLQLADWEREAGHWDFALVVTGRDLHTYYGDMAYGAPSRALDCAVVSLARLRPPPDDPGNGDQLARRLAALVLHLFGHLNNLVHCDDPEDYMAEPTGPGDLERMTRYGSDDREILQAALERVADARLEETARPPALVFYAHAAWVNRQDLWEAVLRARPWQFPFRFSRLTTAALSALLVLSVTAEAWELGMTRPSGLVTVLSLLVLSGTSLFILARQSLLRHGRTRSLSEQRVAVTTAAVLTTVLGMLSVYLTLFLATLLFGLVLVPGTLIASWAPTVPQPVPLGAYLTMAGLTAALGTLIGALGASFEGSTYFRHVLFIDEET